MPRNPIEVIGISRVIRMDGYFSFGRGISRGVWDFTHEMAHQLDWYLSLNWTILGGEISSLWKAEIWLGSDKNPNDGPTSYARKYDANDPSHNGLGEDFADSMTTYLWERHASSWTAPQMIWGYELPVLDKGWAEFALTKPREEFLSKVLGSNAKWK